METLLSALLLSALLLQSSPGAQASPVASRAAGDLPPLITIDAGPFLDEPRGSLPRTVLKATVEDPEGGPVTLRMLESSNGAVLEPALKVPTPFTRDVFLTFVGANSGARLRIVLEAEDPSGNRTREVFERPDINLHDTRLLVADVTGDGKPDVIGAAPLADVAGVRDAGALYVWANQETPRGVPTATLARSSPRRGERIGALEFGRGIEVFDFNADGILDVVAVTYGPTGPDGLRTCAYVFFGSKELGGDVAPGVRLVAPLESRPVPLLFDVNGDGEPELLLQERGGCDDEYGWNYGDLHVWAATADAVGRTAPNHVLSMVREGSPPDGCGFSDSLAFGDLTGDGCEDILFSTRRSSISGVEIVELSDLHVWQAGKLEGARPATSFVRTILDSDGEAWPAVSYAASPDLTGDGLTDLVALAARSSGTSLVAVVWEGGPAFLRGDAPVAELHLPVELAHRNPVGQLSCDLTGDGQRDLLVMLESPVDGSAAYAFALWAGGFGLSGVLLPHAVLDDPAAPGGAVPNPCTFSCLPQPFALPLLADVTADGDADLVGLYADGIRVWAGGPALSGNPAPTTVLTETRLDGRRTLDRVRLADVTGDGVVDVIGQESIGGILPGESLGLFVWAGPIPSGSGQPTRTLGIPDMPASAYVSFPYPLHIRDLNGDGVRDLLASPWQVASAWIWYGGGSGDEPGARLLLGQVAGRLALADFTGDGILDVWSVESEASFGSVQRAGAVQVWEGGLLLGDSEPSFVLGGRFPAEGDRLGRELLDGGASFRFHDFDGDGFVDFFGAAGEADVGGVPDAGALYIWKGPLSATRQADGRMRVRNSQPGDRLGGWGWIP